MKDKEVKRLDIIIVCDSLRVGGIQRSLINLLNNIDYSKYNVTLFLFSSDNDYEDLDERVKLIYANKLLNLTNTLPQKVLKKSKFMWIIRKFIAFICKILGSNIVYKFMFLFEKSLDRYDTAISYTNNANTNSVYFGSNKFVLEKINAKRKISWLHVDYEKMHLHNKNNIKEYEAFDTIVHVSEAVKETFLKFNPKMASKSHIMYNFINEEVIEDLSKQYVVERAAAFEIVSIGRLEENKSPKTYIEIAIELSNKNIDFRWLIIGEGGQRDFIQKEILKHNLQEKVCLTGELKNPYPYIKAADLLVSASHSESFGLAIAEALCLNKPVIARNYPALKELIQPGVNGLIGYDDQELLNYVVNIIQNKRLYGEIVGNSGIPIASDVIKNQFKKIMSAKY